MRNVNTFLEDERQVKELREPKPQPCKEGSSKKHARLPCRSGKAQKQEASGTTESGGEEKLKRRTS